MPPKGKADTAGYQQLKKDLSAQAPGKLYILHGEETYLRDYCLNQLKELILSGGMGTFNFHEIPAKEMSPRRLEEALDCLPMMAQRTLVQVTDFDLFKAGEKDREAYAKLFEELPDYVCLVFVYDLIPYKGDARTKLAGAIKRSGVVVNFPRQETGELVKWVRRRFRALGKDIDGNLASELIFLCGDLMTNLIGEIEKIGAYAKGSQITRADIDAVATPQLDTVVFRMTDAIGAGKFDQAAQVLGELFQMAAVLRPPGSGEGERGLLRGRPVGPAVLPGGEDLHRGPAVLPALVPPGGGPVRRGGPGHEVHRPGRAAAAHQPAAGAVRPRPEARPAPAVRGFPC